MYPATFDILRNGYPRGGLYYGEVSGAQKTKGERAHERDALFPGIHRQSALQFSWLQGLSRIYLPNDV